ncbi:MAG: hypothetical protein ACRYFS_03645 [Janthinobacterium lividum]
MPRIINLTGQKFGWLEVLEMASERRHAKIVWLCKCECGNLHKVTSNSLRSGETKSCGCWRVKIAKELSLSNKTLVSPYSEKTLRQMYEIDRISTVRIARMATLCLGENVNDVVVGRWLQEAGVQRRSRIHAAIIRAKRNPAHIRRMNRARILAIEEGRLIIDNRHFFTPKVRQKALKTRLKTYALRKAKMQHEAEQSAAIEQALNGETFG